MIKFIVLFTNGKRVFVQACDKRQAVKEALEEMLPCYTQRHVLNVEMV